MQFSRGSGILVPLASLPSPFGIGDLGPQAYEFVDWLVETQQSYWQVLPFSITGVSGCPYSSISAYGGSPLLISPELLVEDHLLVPRDIQMHAYLFGPGKIEYSRVEEFKYFLFHKAFDNFQRGDHLHQEFAAFLKAEKEWCLSLAYFIALSEQFGAPWAKWPEPFKHRHPDALEHFAQKNYDQVLFHEFLQFIFFRQWERLKKYANQKGIKIIGDIPIFLNHHSMDIWQNPQFFKLNQFRYPYVVTGAPPDDFCQEGQNWGNPNYDWQVLEQDGFSWWIKRMAFNLRHYDVVRLDHFRGFAATWEIRAEQPDARQGYWATTPGYALFHKMQDKLGDLPIIVEDLGKITPDVDQLRQHFNFPGMKVLQFAFNKGWNAPNLPHNFEENYVVYTGTHDTMTTKGWFYGLGDTLERDFCLKYTKALNWENINWSLIALAMGSKASLAITPLQDVIGIGNEGRINTPGTDHNNWSWRFTFGQIAPEDSAHLRQLTIDTQRGRPA